MAVNTNYVVEIYCFDKAFVEEAYGRRLDVAGICNRLGVFDSIPQAEDSLISNAPGYDEHRYSYAIIGKVWFGSYPMLTQNEKSEYQFYKYIRESNKWGRCSSPLPNESIAFN